MSHESILLVRALVESTLALLIVLDPFGLLPLVVAVTGKMSNKQRQRMLTRAVLIAFCLLIVFAFGGKAILTMFKISTDDLSVAGGLLLLVIALSIVIHGHMSASDAAADVGHIGVVPIASPLLVGPGSIATAVLIVEKYGPSIAAVAVTGAFFLTWLVLRATSLIYRVIGKNGSDAIARIMGVLLAAYATGLIREGVVNIIRAACKGQ